MNKLILSAALAAVATAGIAAAQTRAGVTPSPVVQRADTNADRAVSRTEALAAADARFAAMDANRDGSVSGEERLTYRKAQLQRRLERRTARMEARPAPAALTQTQFREQALRRFDAIDRDRDGQVTAQDRVAFRSAMRARRAAPQQ